MNKTKIEWCDYTTNPVKGLCPMVCSYCYARRMYKRYKWNETVRLDMVSFLDGLDALPKKPCRVFVGSTMELFGPWVEDDWMKRILYQVSLKPEHTFIFLTKQPQNLTKWSPFPANCHVGVSTTNKAMFNRATFELIDIVAPVRFVSVEPLLDWKTGGRLDFSMLNWLILGQQTPVSAKTAPKVEWLREIVEAADKANVPVFLKNNLYDLLPTEPPFFFPDRMPDGSSAYTMRQELPRVAVGAAQ